MQRTCATAWQVRAPRASNKQRIAGEYAILDPQAHGIACVSGSMQCLQPQLPDCEKFTALQAQVDERSWTRAVHHHRPSQLASKLPGRGKMIRVRVRIDEIPDAQTISCSQRNVPVDLAELGVDQRGGAGFLASDHIGPAAARRYCFE